MDFIHSKISIESILNSNIGNKWYPNKMVRDYLLGKDISDIYTSLPDISSFPKAIKAKENKGINRKLLVDVLTSQYGNCSSIPSGIKELGKENCFTVTTGHQLSLFTGPLFFIYKIISTINLSETLKNVFPNYEFVPVFWMASEDHDFEEINHINIYGKKLEWKDFQGGAVGRYSTDTINHIVKDLSELLGDDKTVASILSAYENNTTLVEATREIVHQLFGKYGLVVIDGDDKRFKSQFSDVLKDELKGISNGLIEGFSKNIEKKYPIQAMTRPLNVFYLQDGSRDRIIRNENDGFSLVNKNVQWNENQLLELIDSHPESFSPNVLLRPLYQEFLLPNVAYTGGPSELAYWFQLKTLFSNYSIPFPVLIPRKSVLILGKKDAGKIKSLGIKAFDLQLDEGTLIKKVIKQKSNIDLDNEKHAIEKIVNEIVSKIKETDPSLEGTVNAEKVKWLKGLAKLESKLNKSEKKKHETSINQLLKLKEKLFPNQSLQERHDNILPFISNYGIEFIDVLKKLIDPLEKDILLIEED